MMEYFVSEYDHFGYMDKFKINSLLAKVLAYYQFDQDKIDQLLNDNDLEAIRDNPAIDKVKKRMIKAHTTNESVFVCGDYDADGICSTAMMVGLLRELKIQCGYYIPNRLTDGYGLSVALVDSVFKKGYKLIITVDNGVKAIDALAKAKSLGIDVIICDHHIIEQQYVFPYLIHPTLLPLAYENLCGAGVVLQLVKAFDIADPKYQILAMAATIGDMVEMFDANRLIVKQGLSLINKLGFLPIEALLNHELVIDEDVIAFRFVPAINTLGRLADQANANVLVEYLLSNDTATIYNTARDILALNDRRKKMVKHTDHQDEAIFETTNYNLYISNDYHEGIIGLLANRLMLDKQKPTLVGTDNGDNYKFSGRSIQGFDIHHQLSKYQELFLTFGGHKQACGLSIKKENLDLFIKYLSQEEKIIDEHVKYPTIKIELGDLSLDNVRSLQVLKPYGTGIKKPLFILDSVDVNDHILLKGKYPKATLKIKDEILEIISFNKAFMSDDGKRTKPIVGHLSLNAFKGKEKMNFMVEDVMY